MAVAHSNPKSRAATGTHLPIYFIEKECSGLVLPLGSHRPHKNVFGITQLKVRKKV